MAMSLQEAGLAASPGDPQQQIAGLSRVLELTKHLAAEKQLDHLLVLIVRQACSAVRCQRASLFLYDAEHRELYTRTMSHPDEIREIRLPCDQGLVGLVASQRRMIHIPDPYQHPLFHPEFDRLSGFRTRNILAAPLVSWNDGRLLGVLNLLNKEEGLFNELDGQLLDVFVVHAAIALERALLARHYEEKVQIEASLKVAHEIQAGFFPRRLPVVPGYELAASSRSADATGGDYYDVLTLDRNRLGLVIADVCGHGVGPSLLMASVRALLRGLANAEATPESLIGRLNQALFDDLRQSRRFITLLYGCLVPEEHRFYYANAGHGPIALHVESAPGRIRSLVDDCARGCPLGLLSPEHYQSCAPVALERGDLLVLGSDGLVETRRGGECFGMERLADRLLQGRQRPLAQLLDELFAATIAFQERDSLDDDLTLLLVRRT